MGTQLITYLTAAEVARKANVPQSQWDKLARLGKLSPDARGGRSYLFREERVAEVRQLLAETFNQKP